MFVIAAFVATEAFPAIKELGIVRFFMDEAWRPTSSDASGFLISPMLVGSLLVTAGAVLVAVPLGILSALFSQYYAPAWLAAAYRRIIELLGGIPSVVFGFWGLVVLVPVINWFEPPGQSLLAGILVLSLMVLPTVALTAESALRGIPRQYLDAAVATGLGRGARIVHVALPAARKGILAGVVLAASRAIGETMAVVMVCGNVVQIPDSLFTPVRTVTANIALEMGYAQATHRSALFVTGLALLILVAAMLLLVDVIRCRRAEG